MTLDEEVSAWMAQIDTLQFVVTQSCYELFAEKEFTNMHVSTIRGAISKLDLCVFQGFHLLHKKFEVSYKRPEPPEARPTVDDVLSEL